MVKFELGNKEECIQHWMNRLFNEHPYELYFGKDEKGEVWVDKDLAWDLIVEGVKEGSPGEILFYDYFTSIYESGSEKCKRLHGAVNWISTLCMECNTNALAKDITDRIYSHWDVLDALKEELIRHLEKHLHFSIYT